MYKLGCIIVRVLFKIFYRIEVIGEISIPGNEAYMICSNHIHAFDPVFLGCFTKREIRFMGKKELFDRPIIGWFLRQLRGFPVDRSKGDIAAIKTAIDILGDGEVVGIFPEGTRSKTGVMGEFKKGAALIAARANVQMVPVKIEGNYKLFSRMALKIGKPVSVTRENRNMVMEELHNAIEQL